MCNPSPQGRCQSDASKAVASKISSFTQALDEFTDRVGEDKVNEIAEHFSQSDRDFSRNDMKVSLALRAVNEAKAFLYATPAAQKNPTEAAKKVAELEAGLTPAQKKILSETNSRARREGKFLSKFQEFARTAAKQDPDTPSIATARKMLHEDFPRAKYRMQENLDKAYKEEVSKAMDETPIPEQGNVRGKLLRKKIDNESALNAAYLYADADAKETVRKDVAKNSATYRKDADNQSFGFHKEYNGSFTIKTNFDVAAKTEEEAFVKAKESFNSKDVQISVYPSDKGGYKAYTAYSYRGGESLDDAKSFHKKVWKGTPQWRGTPEQVKSQEDFYDQDHKQGRYAE